jgi:hypothetical protein
LKSAAAQAAGTVSRGCGDLKLDLSEEKTLLTNATKQKFPPLNKSILLILLRCHGN